MKSEESKVYTQWEPLWRTRCLSRYARDHEPKVHSLGMVKSEESKVYAKREPLWRILRYEQSEFGRNRGLFVVFWIFCRNSYVLFLASILAAILLLKTVRTSVHTHHQVAQVATRNALLGSRF